MDSDGNHCSEMDDVRMSVKALTHLAVSIEKQFMSIQHRVATRPKNLFVDEFPVVSHACKAWCKSRGFSTRAVSMKDILTSILSRAVYVDLKTRMVRPHPTDCELLGLAETSSLFEILRMIPTWIEMDTPGGSEYASI